VRYLLDTNILIEAAGNTAPAVAALQQAVVSDWVGYPHRFVYLVYFVVYPNI